MRYSFSRYSYIESAMPPNVNTCVWVKFIVAASRAMGQRPGILVRFCCASRALVTRCTES